MDTDLTASLAPAAKRDVALCRSLFYEALSLGFRPPAGGAPWRFGSAEAAAALAAAAALLDADARAVLETKVRALVSHDDLSDPAAQEAILLGLFGHTGRGTVPPYETEYGDDTLFERPQELSDLAGFLTAFGLRLGPATRERIDHISCELEFLAFLARKEAHAVETGDAEMAEETRRATRLFLRDHLGRFLPSFAHRVMRADPDGFYGRLAGLCLEFVRGECARFAVPIGPGLLRLRLPIEDQAPMACGSAGGGVDGCAPGPGGPGPCGPEEP